MEALLARFLAVIFIGFESGLVVYLYFILYFQKII